MVQRMLISCQFITSDGSRGRSLRDWHRHQQDLGPQAWLEWSLPGKIINLWNVFVFRIALSQGWLNHSPGQKPAHQDFFMCSLTFFENYIFKITLATRNPNAQIRNKFNYRTFLKIQFWTLKTKWRQTIQKPNKKVWILNGSKTKLLSKFNMIKTFSFWVKFPEFEP